MKNKDRRDDGRYTPAVTDSELLAAVRTHEPAATSEVAGEVDMTRQGVDRRLRQLRDDGRVNSKKIGASLVWFAPDASGDTPRETGERPDTPTHGGESAPTGEAGSGTQRVDAGPTTAVDFPDAVDDAVSEMAGGDELPDTRAPALREAVTQLRQDGEATVDDLVRGAYQREAGGFSVADSYRRSITSALDALAERRAEIETDGDGYVWHGGEGD